MAVYATGKKNARILVLGSLAESLTTFRGALLKEMVEAGYKVFTCAPNAPQHVRDELSREGIIYHELEMDRAGTNPINDTKSLIRFFNTFKDISPDVFLGYTIKPVIYGSIAARLAGVPKIFSIVTGLGYAFSNSGFKSTVTGILAKRLYSLALSSNRNVFFQNPDDMRLFTEKGIVKGDGKAVLVNGSGVDLEKFAYTPIPPSISFLLIARLIKQKGIYEYVEAARVVRRQYPQVKFRLVGFIDKNPTSISEKDLKSWVDSGTIEYFGYLKDVRPAIANSSVYVLPSYYPEGTPRSVLEAMAMGRPIITSDTPGCRETVRHGQNGFLIPTKDVGALIESMVHFIKYPDNVVNMGHVSRQIAVEKYDVHKVNAVMLKTMELA